MKVIVTQDEPNSNNKKEKQWQAPLTKPDQGNTQVFLKQ